MTNNILKLLALVFSSAFSAGLLITSIVVVDSWSQLEPVAAIDWFSIYGLTLGFGMAPMGFLSVVFTLIAFISVSKRRDEFSQKALWSLALVCTFGTMALLPVYFGEANTAFF